MRNETRTVETSENVKRPTPINRELRHRVDTERVVGGNVDWLLTLSPYPQFPLLAIGSLLFCINTNPGAVRIKGNEAEKKMKPW